MGASAKYLELWTEHSPVPSNLSDTEILDWLGEYCDHVEYNLPTRQYSGGYTVHSTEGEITFAPTLRGAICLADAVRREASQ